MNVIEEQVNIGRFLSAMNLEDAVLANGVLPNQRMEERTSLIQGMLKGMLESGNWQKAVHEVYNPGTVKALFDGNREGFNDAVIAAAREQKPDTKISGKFVKFLVDHNQTGVVCRLIEEIPYNQDNLNNLFNGVYDSVDETVRSRLRDSIGASAQEAGDFVAAHSFFDNNSNTDSIDALYLQILADPVENIDLLLEIADKDKARLTEIVKEVLKIDEEELHGVDVHYTKIEKVLYELVQKHEIELLPEENVRLLDLASNVINTWDNGKAGDKNLALLWAKKHYKHNPETAYQIFMAQDYAGDEVMAAVRVAFSEEYLKGSGHFHSSRELNVSIFREEHLRAVYSEQDAWTRVKIAGHLEDKNALLGLSRELFKEESFESAYNLWVSGGGSFDDPFAEELRQGIIAAEEGKSYFSDNLFDRNDVPGKTWLFNKLFDTGKLSSAFDIAEKLGDEEKMQRAREKMVERDPAWAIGIFMQKYSTDEDIKDRAGFDMCVTALSEKYGIPERAVVQYVAAGKE